MVLGGQVIIVLSSLRRSWFGVGVGLHAKIVIFKFLGGQLSGGPPPDRFHCVIPTNSFHVIFGRSLEPWVLRHILDFIKWAYVFLKSDPGKKDCESWFQNQTINVIEKKFSTTNMSKFESKKKKFIFQISKCISYRTHTASSQSTPSQNSLKLHEI